MTIANMLSITPSPFLSVLIWILLILAALYFARRPFHRAVGSFSKIIYNALRLTSTTVLQSEKRLAQRNREVLITAGLENAERAVEREFDRISTAVVRDLETYPSLQRQLSELTTQLDENYTKGADVPVSLPNWIPIIESIAQIKHNCLPIRAIVLYCGFCDPVESFVLARSMSSIQIVRDNMVPVLQKKLDDPVSDLPPWRPVSGVGDPNPAVLQIGFMVIAIHHIDTAPTLFDLLDMTEHRFHRLHNYNKFPRLAHINTHFVFRTLLKKT